MTTTEQAQHAVDTLSDIRDAIQNTIMIWMPPWSLNHIGLVEENVLATKPKTIAAAVATTREQISVVTGP
jgi:hypothetical protein